MLLVDKALEGRKNLVAGANKEDYHLKNVTPGRDFQPTAYADLRSVTAGEACPNCGAPLRIDTAVEIGHIFKLGYKYSESMGARVLDKNGKEVMPIMGCYGIGIERILTAAIEQNNDENGFWLPPQIAPFEIVVTPTNVSDEKLLSTAEDIAAAPGSRRIRRAAGRPRRAAGGEVQRRRSGGYSLSSQCRKEGYRRYCGSGSPLDSEIQDASIAAITEYFEKNLRSAR